MDLMGEMALKIECTPWKLNTAAHFQTLAKDDPISSLFSPLDTEWGIFHSTETLDAAEFQLHFISFLTFGARDVMF